MEGTLDQTTGTNQTQLAAFFACEEPQLLTYLRTYVPTVMYIHTCMSVHMLESPIANLSRHRKSLIITETL